MKNNITAKYSVSATLRAASKGDSFVIPFEHSTNGGIAHIASRQINKSVTGKEVSTVSVHKEAKGYRVIVNESLPKGTQKLTYKLEKGFKLPEGSRRGRPTLVAAAAKAAKSKGKANKPAAKVVKTPAKKAPAKKAAPAKANKPKAKATKKAAKVAAPTNKRVMLGGKKVIAPAPPFAK